MSSARRSGPSTHAGHHHYLPRFVYFGPHTSEESPRIAFLAGLDSRDLRPTLALLHLVEELALAPDIGQSLHLAFYPLVDVLGHLQPGSGPRFSRRSTGPRPPHPRSTRWPGKPGCARTTRLCGSSPRRPTTPSRCVCTPRPARWPTPRSFLGGHGALSRPLGNRIRSAARRRSALAAAKTWPFRPIDLTLRIPANWSPSTTARPWPPSSNASLSATADSSLMDSILNVSRSCPW